MAEPGGTLVRTYHTARDSPGLVQQRQGADREDRHLRKTLQSIQPPVCLDRNCGIYLAKDRTPLFTYFRDSTLALYHDYPRKQVHDLFDPESTFTPQACTWGLQGIIEPADELRTLANPIQGAASLRMNLNWAEFNRASARPNMTEAILLFVLDENVCNQLHRSRTRAALLEKTTKCCHWSVFRRRRASEMAKRLCDS
jgi:hypothetical protein